MQNTRKNNRPIGWPLLPVPNGRGELDYPNLEVSVQESIRVILSTRPKEQLMRPGFGAGLALFVHEPNTLVTRRRIRDLVQESLALWEPRIVVDRIDVDEVEGAPTHLRVEIYYRLHRTGQAQRTGLTMETGG